MMAENRIKQSVFKKVMKVWKECESEKVFTFVDKGILDMTIDETLAEVREKLKELETKRGLDNRIPNSGELIEIYTDFKIWLGEICGGKG